MEKYLRELSNTCFTCFSNSHSDHWLNQNLEVNLDKAEELIKKIREEQKKKEQKKK